MAYQKFWNSDNLSLALNIPPCEDLWIDTSKDEEVKGYGMLHNRPHTEDAKKKMRETPKPGLHKGGTIIAPNGKKVKFTCLSHFCKEYGLSRGHVSELMSGKRHTVKGWKRGTL